jgi:hypothetical protein
MPISSLFSKVAAQLLDMFLTIGAVHSRFVMK